MMIMPHNIPMALQFLPFLIQLIHILPVCLNSKAFLTIIYLDTFYMYNQLKMKSVLFKSFLCWKLIISKFPNNISELYSVNRKKVAIIIDNRITANKLIEEPIFSEKGLKICIAFHIYSKQIMVKNIDLNITMNEVVNFDITEGNRNILSARRLNRRINSGTEVRYIPSSSILVIIDSRVLPKHFLLHRIRYNVVPYKPKPKQCFNCFKFGHLKNGCRFKSVCIHCGLITTLVYIALLTIRILHA